MTAANLLAWGAQALILACVSVLAPMLLRFRSSRAELILSQAVLAGMLMLPFLQPRVSPPAPERPVAQAPVAASKSVPMREAPRGLAASLPDIEMILLAGVLVRLLWLIAGMLRLSRYRREGSPAEPNFHAEDLTGARAEFLISDALPNPVTFGWRRPAVVVSPAYLGMPDSQRLAVTCHELLHVRRCDWLACLAEEFAVALMWFHPVAWFLLRRIRSAREQVVDAEVIRLTGNREPYIDALLAAAAAGRPMLDVAAAPLFIRRRDLTRRVQVMLQERKPMSHIRTVLCSAFLTGAVVCAGVYSTIAFPLLGAPQSPAGVIARTESRGLPDSVRPTVEALLLGLRGQSFTTNVMTQVKDDLARIDPNLVRSWVEERPGEYSLSVGYKTGKGSESLRVAEIDASRVPQPWRALVTARLNAFINMPYSNSVMDNINANVQAVDRRIALRWRANPDGSMIGILLWDPPPQSYQVVSGVLNRINTDGLPADLRDAVNAKLAKFRNAPLTNALMDEIRSMLLRDHPGLAFSWQTVGNDTSVMIWQGPASIGGAVKGAPAPPPNETIIRIAPEVLAAKRRGGNDPEYPPLAQQVRVQGIVKVQVDVQPDGKVRTVNVISGHPMLLPAAVAAVTTWQFEPTLLNGTPVAVTAELSIPFTLPPR